MSSNPETARTPQEITERRYAQEDVGFSGYWNNRRFLLGHPIQEFCDANPELEPTVYSLVWTAWREGSRWQRDRERSSQKS